MTASMQTVKASFHGVEYVVNWNCDKSSLSVVVEDDAEELYWTATYDSHYIEQVTHKTGNFKRFSVFSQMLTSALLSPTPHLFADLLTLQDLELLRSRMTTMDGTKPTKSLSASSNSLHGKNDKRYLIVTYMTEFDRIHYPLPLLHCTEPSPSVLHQTIRRLRNQVQQTQRKYPELGMSEERERSTIMRDLEDATKQMRDLGNENRMLRKKLESQAVGMRKSGKGSVGKERIETLESDRRRLEGKLERITAEFNKARNEWNHERGDWEHRLAQYQEQIERFDEDNSRLRHQLKVMQTSGGSNDSSSIVRKLQRSLKESNAAQDLLRQRLSKLQSSHRRQVEQLKLDLRNIREANLSLRKKVRDSTSSTQTHRGRQAHSPRSRHVVSSRQTNVSPRPVRGNSSTQRNRSRSPGPAFDPTEYQRKKEERLQRIKERNSRMVQNRLRSSNSSRSPLRASRTSTGSRSSRTRDSSQRTSGNRGRSVNQKPGRSSRSNSPMHTSRNPPPSRGRSPLHRSGNTRKRNDSPMSASQSSLHSRGSARENRDRPWRSSSNTSRKSNTKASPRKQNARTKRGPRKERNSTSSPAHNHGRSSNNRPDKFRTESSRKVRELDSPRSRASFLSDGGYQSGGSSASVVSSGGGTRKSRRDRGDDASVHSETFAEMDILRRQRAANAEKVVLLDNPAYDDDEITNSVMVSAAELMEGEPLKVSTSTLQADSLLGSTPEIQDIDDRLSKLSNFLKAAKDSVTKLSEPTTY